jgi:hypothetical protein
LLRLVAALLSFSIAGNVLLLLRSRRPSGVGAAEVHLQTVRVTPVARAGVPRRLPALQLFLPSAGRGDPPATRCGPAVRALAAAIEDARAQLERLLPANQLFASGTVNPEVTRTFQGTIDGLVSGHRRSIKEHSFACTDRACRLSVLMDDRQEDDWLPDLRLGLLRTHGNLPQLMVSGADNIVERSGESPLTQTDTFFKVIPLDQLTGDEAESARQMVQAVSGSVPAGAEQIR